MMKNSSFCAIILSHGRADNVKTYGTLRKLGYTGPIRVLVDDEDASVSEYKKRYGDEVIVFSKDEAAKITDPMDNFHDRRTPLFARNIIWKYAKELGVEYFVELDDDYGDFLFHFRKDLSFTSKQKLSNLDAVFDCLVDFLAATPTTVIATAQGGDFIGGPSGFFGKKIFLRRKTMNVFVCKTDRPFKFYGTMNDDVNSYVRNGNIGILHFTNNFVCVQQPETQRNSGGITELYRDRGTYNKSFYTIMMNPTCCKIAVMGQVDRRIHHRIDWKFAVPKIVAEKYKKPLKAKKR